MRTMTDPTTDAVVDLDAWLPDPEIVTRHRRAALADPDALWAAARRVRLDQTRTIGRLVRWRIPGVPPDQSFMGLLAEDPFAVLAEGTHHSVSGLCGRIWTLSRDYPQLSGPDGRSTLHSEARVAPTDSIAAMRLRVLWLAVGPFERLIGAEALALAAEQAQAQQGAAPSG
jgi:hypothetical protein